MNPNHLALLERHRNGIVNLLAKSRLDPVEVVVIIADVRSRVGRAFVDAGLAPAPGRTSIAVPTSIDSAPIIAEVLDLDEVRRLRNVHGATALVVIDERDDAGVTFERFQSRHHPRR